MKLMVKFFMVNGKEREYEIAQKEKCTKEEMLAFIEATTDKIHDSIINGSPASYKVTESSGLTAVVDLSKVDTTEMYIIEE